MLVKTPPKHWSKYTTNKKLFLCMSKDSNGLLTRTTQLKQCVPLVSPCLTCWSCLACLFSKLHTTQKNTQKHKRPFWQEGRLTVWSIKRPFCKLMRIELNIRWLAIGSWRMSITIIVHLYIIGCRRCSINRGRLFDNYRIIVK